MKTIRINDGFLTLAESKAKCPHCERSIPYDEIESKFIRQEKHYIRMKCKCKRYVGIAMDFMGDFVAFDLKK